MNLITSNELLGLGNLPAEAPERQEVRSALRAKATRLSTTGATGKALFEKMLFRLPQGIRSEVLSGRLQLVDEVIYSRRDLQGGFQELDLMQSADNKAVGVTNLDRQKIEANKWTLVTGFQLKTVTYHASTAPSIYGGTDQYGLAHPAVLNGEFEMEVGATVVVPNVSCAVFDTGWRTDVPVGYWDGFDPVFITPNTEIKPKLKLAYALGTSTPLYVFFAIYCVSLAKN
jgi:hypothetical protein